MTSEQHDQPGQQHHHPTPAQYWKIAGLLAVLWEQLRMADGKNALRKAFGFILHPSVWILLALWASGWALKQMSWTDPIGEPVSVSLIQGNVAQDLKWRADRVAPTLERYRSMVFRSESRLIVLPETALPLFLDQVPPRYLEELSAHARRNGGDILIGIVEGTPEYDAARAAIIAELATTYGAEHYQLGIEGIRARTNRTVAELEGRTNSLQARYTAEAERVIAEIEYDGERQINELLSSSGGRSLVALEAAQNLSFDDQMTFNSERIPFLLQLGRIADALMGR